MEYKGRWNYVNKRPEGEWILVFASDWFKDHWCFYAYIRVTHYQEDIDKIVDLIQELNVRDGDVYVELINHSNTTKELRQFYHQMCREGYFTHWNILRPENWQKHYPSFSG